MARDSFIFYRSFYEAISEIPIEYQAEVYDAIMKYALNQEEIKLSGVSKAIFSLVKPQLDANYKKYENGKQSKSKIKAKVKQKESKTKTNVNDNDNVNENVNVNDNDNIASDSCIDGLQEVIDFYNENIGIITPYGLEIFQDFAKEMDCQVIIYAMKLSVEADKRNIKYIKAILNNWARANIKTLIEAQKETQNFKKQEKGTNELEDF